jgi:hypothetical protein
MQDIQAAAASPLKAPPHGKLHVQGDIAGHVVQQEQWKPRQKTFISVHLASHRLLILIPEMVRSHVATPPVTPLLVPLSMSLKLFIIFSFQFA